MHDERALRSFCTMNSPLVRLHRLIWKNRLFLAAEIGLRSKSRTRGVFFLAKNEINFLSTISAKLLLRDEILYI